MNIRFVKEYGSEKDFKFSLRAKVRARKNAERHKARIEARKKYHKNKQYKEKPTTFHDNNFSHNHRKK